MKEIANEMAPVTMKINRNRHDSLADLSGRDMDDFMEEMGDEISVPVIKGDWEALSSRVRRYIAENVRLCRPKGVYICDGSEEEAEEITEKMVNRGLLTKLDKYENCYLCRTDPADVARVEGKTFIVTDEKYKTVPHVADGVKGILGQWMSPEDAKREMIEDRFPGCMKGRVMYVIPFSMGPVGGALSKVGVQLTDFNYVVLSMRVMTRVSSKIWDVLGEDGEFVQCIHSIGAPRPLQRKVINHWPCNPERILITHFPDQRKIMSYGSGYGGNSLLGKKCFALRIASRIAKDEGWLAEHMLILGVTNPQGEEKFIAAAFPSACGKTNLAMLTPSLPGWKVRCLGDDIAWMRFDKDGRLRAINPEAGFFGVAPGTNMKTNPVAMETCMKNTIFTNVGMTEDGGVFWEGMEKETDRNTDITTWLGAQWRIGDKGKAAHPNSRFCCPASQCPIIHDKWEDPEGVPIDAIVFGGRRPEGVPLVFESFGWEHGVMLGAALKSEATAAAEFKGKQIMHDPMAMRPFMGYNFGDYLQHWLSLNQPGRHMPKIFHVNWFRLNENGKFVWPGFGENIRVLDWICRRVNGEDIAEPSAIGQLPVEGSLNLKGLDVSWEENFSLPKRYWEEDIQETKQFLENQVGCDLPETIAEEVRNQEERIGCM
jgi:phosphoenolpyruvate carboxykinase (GTP)